MFLGEIYVVPISSCKLCSDGDLHRTPPLPSLKAHCCLFWYRWPPMLSSWCWPVRLPSETPAATWKNSLTARNLIAILTEVVTGDSWIAILWVKVCEVIQKNSIKFGHNSTGPQIFRKYCVYHIFNRRRMIFKCVHFFFFYVSSCH